MTESRFSFTGKLNGTDLFTVRGDSADEFAVNMKAAIAAINNARELHQALSGTNGLTSMDKAIEVLTDAGLAPTAVAGAIEVLKDKYGNEWTYGHPDAPDLPDGRGKYAKKKGVSKAGKTYVGWFDPAKGPKPFKPGATEAETIWAK